MTQNPRDASVLGGWIIAEQRINVTVTKTPSTRLDMKERGLTEMARASVHYYNSEDELERFCAVLASM